MLLSLQHGVSVILVMVYGGRQTSLFPDEMALPIARHLASIGVDIIIGYHPNGIQGHAYMGKTLVLFSLGHVLSSDHRVPYCWNKVRNEALFTVLKLDYRLDFRYTKPGDTLQTRNVLKYSQQQEMTCFRGKCTQGSTSYTSPSRCTLKTMLHCIAATIVYFQQVGTSYC